MCYHSGARVDLGLMAMKGYFTLPNAPALPEPHHIQDMHCDGGLTPLQRCRQCIARALANWAD